MNNYKVVIIENVLSDLKVIENVFNNRSNFVVYKKFDNLLSFLNFMKFVNCRIDFLVVNIFMPGSNPIDLLKEISKYKSHINKIICTGGFASNEILGCMNNYDVSYFINKPFTEKSLRIPAEILSLIEEKKIDTASLITHSFPLSRIDEAYKIFENKEDGVIKIAIENSY